MAALIKGITVTLYERQETGRDPFNAPVYQETPVEVADVLVYPTAQENVTSDLQLYGKRAVYDLCIPKGDTHEWEGAAVAFFGQKFRAFGPVIQYIESNVPLNWNKKVRVERYG